MFHIGKTLAFASILTLCASSVGATVLFEDNFDRSDNIAVGAGWLERDRNNNDVGVFANALRLRDETDPSGGDLPAAAAVTPIIHAAGFSNITLAFDWNTTRNLEGPDQLFVSFALAPTPPLNGENAWVEVFNVANDPIGPGSVAATVPLNGAENAQFRVMFWTDVSSANEGYIIDNVVVTGIVPVPGALPLLGAIVACGLVVSRRRGARTV